MVALSYAGTDWATAFTAMPEPPARLITPVVGEGGQITGENHTIRFQGWMVASGATADAMQEDLAARVAVMEALGHGGALIYTDNDGDVIWAYDSAASANNHQTLHGLRMEIDFATGDVADLTNRPYTVTFTAEVARCSNDPLTGIGSLSYSIAESWDRGGIAGLTYSGSMCACDGYDGETILEDLFGYLTDDARDRYTAAGHVLSAEWGWTGMERSCLDPEDCDCWSFTLSFGGGGSVSTDSAAETINVRWDLRIIQNLIELRVAGTYTYVGEAGVTATGSAFGTGVSLPGWGGSGGAVSTFNDVREDAIRHKGIAYRNYLPAGAGTLMDVQDTGMTGDEDAHTITCTKVYRFNWIHDAAIVLYDETVQVGNYVLPAGFPPRPLSMHVLSPTPSDPNPYVYPQRSGFMEQTLTIQIRLVASDGYKTIPARIPPDGINVFYEGGRNQSYKQVDPPQVFAGLTGSLANRAWYETTVTQVYRIRDMSAVSVQVAHIGALSAGGGGGGGFAGPATNSQVTRA